MQGMLRPPLAGARSSSDALDDESRRRIAPKPDEQASPSQHSSPDQSPPGEMVASSLHSSDLIALPPGMVPSSPPVYSISDVMRNQILYDSQAVAHLLQQDVNATSTIRQMEHAFSTLRAQHLQADDARRAHDIQTQNIIEVGVAKISATHDRLLATEAAAEFAASTAARHIQQLMAEAAALRQHSTATDKRLDLTQSVVQESHHTNNARISATQNAVFQNAQSARQDDYSITAATLEGFASIQDKADA
jgi:hypothetical protein